MNTTKLLDGTLAELYDIETAEVSFVPAGANGFPLLAVKSVDGEFELPASKLETPRWVAAGDRDLDINSEIGWDGSAAAARVFEWAGWTDDAETSDPDPSKAKLAFTFYDAANDDLRGSYKNGFADIVDGELVAIAAGLAQARARINQVQDVPQDVIEAGQSTLDAYARRQEEEETSASAEKGADPLTQLARKILAAQDDQPEIAQLAKLMDAATLKIHEQAAQIRDLRRQLEKSQQRVSIPAHIPESHVTRTAKTQSPWPLDWRAGQAHGLVGRDQDL